MLPAGEPRDIRVTLTCTIAASTHHRNVSQTILVQSLDAFSRQNPLKSHLNSRTTDASRSLKPTHPSPPAFGCPANHVAQGMARAFLNSSDRSQSKFSLCLSQYCISKTPLIRPSSQRSRIRGCPASSNFSDPRGSAVVVVSTGHSSGSRKNLFGDQVNVDSRRSCIGLQTPQFVL